MIGAVVVHDDGAAGSDELVHLAPGAYPGRYAEGAELPDGAFEIPDKRLQKLFAVDGMPEDFFERGDGAIQVGVIGGVAIDVDADSHRERRPQRILLHCHPRGSGDLPLDEDYFRENPAELAFAIENVVGPFDRNFWRVRVFRFCAIPICGTCLAFLRAFSNIVECFCERESCNLRNLCEIACGYSVERD